MFTKEVGLYIANVLTFKRITTGLLSSGVAG